MLTATHRALDHHFSLGGNVRGLELVSRVLRTLEAATDVPPSSFYTLTIGDSGALAERDGVPIYEGDPGTALRLLMSTINMAAVASLDGALMVHASVVGDDHGAIVIPGPSGTGKSTMAAALVDRGLRYLSDEIAPIVTGGMVVPYPKPLMVGGMSFDEVEALRPMDLCDGTFDVWFLDPRRFSGGYESRPQPIRAVVSLEYVPRATVEISQMTPGETTAVLACNAFNMARSGRDGLELAAGAARYARGVRILHGGASSAVDHIIEVMRRSNERRS